MPIRAQVVASPPAKLERRAPFSAIAAIPCNLALASGKENAFRCNFAVENARDNQIVNAANLVFPLEVADDSCMDWFIRYRTDNQTHVERHGSLDGAIEAACRLMDSGHVVYGIGYKTTDNSIEKPEIDDIYSIWQRANGPFAARA